MKYTVVIATLLHLLLCYWMNKTIPLLSIKKDSLIWIDFKKWEPLSSPVQHLKKKIPSEPPPSPSSKNLGNVYPSKNSEKVPPSKNTQPKNTQWLSLDQVVQWGNEPPSYPAIALAQRQSGTVVLLLSVDRTGHVVNIQVVKSSGYNILNEEAIQTAKDWTFPVSIFQAQKDEEATKLSQLVAITFRLDE